MLPKIFVFLLCAAQLGIYLAPTDSWAHTGAGVGAAPCQDPGKVQQGVLRLVVRKVMMIWEAEEQECQCLPQFLQHYI